MKFEISVVKVIIGVIAGAWAYEIGRKDGYNEHVNKCKDVLINKLVEKEEKES